MSSFKREIPGGLFIAFEGLHGSGKSTQIEILTSRLSQEGYSVVNTKEVAGTKLSDQIFEIISQKDGEAFEDPLIMTLMIAASRASRVSKIIQPALLENKIVIADRYEATMFARQCYCDGVDRDLIAIVNRNATGGLHPDLNILLDISVDESFRRRLGRLGERGKFSGWESQSSEFYSRFRKAYLMISNSEPNWMVVNAANSKEEVFDNIYNSVVKLIGKKQSLR